MSTMKRHISPALLTMILMLALTSPGILATEHDTGTPAELVAAYDSLADSILAVKQTERHMVQSILATTFSHAQATLGAVQKKMAGGENAGAEIEKLADLVSQLGNEGDAAVAAIRKRLVEGGHHHNAQGEKDGIYDEGFVIVTRAARKALLASAGNIARMAASPNAEKLKAEWSAVATQYKSLVKGD
jgi:riboflavin biosynthesis pyrimidine reductase